MRISFLSSGLGAKLGGPAFSEVDLINELLSRHEVTVFCPYDRFVPERSTDLPKTKVTPFYRREVIEAWQNSQHVISKALASSDILHVNGHWRWENYFFCRLAQRKGVPYVLHPRGMLIIGHKRRQLKKLFNVVIGNNITRNASSIIALSRFETEAFGPYSFLPSKVYVVPNGLNCPSNFPNFSVPKKYFLYLGRINPRKNLEFLISAYEIYRTMGGNIPLRLVGPEEPEYAKVLKEKVKQASLQSSITFQGGIFGSEKDKILSEALAVIYPALDEAFGRVPFEALANGSLPIVSQESGSAEFLRPFLNDMFYSAHDSLDLAKKMVKSTELTSDRVEKMKAAFDWMSRELNWKTIAKSIEGVYAKSLPINRGSLTFPSLVSNDSGQI